MNLLGNRRADASGGRASPPDPADGHAGRPALASGGLANAHRASARASAPAYLRERARQPPEQATSDIAPTRAARDQRHPHPSAAGSPGNPPAGSRSERTARSHLGDNIPRSRLACPTFKLQPTLAWRPADVHERAGRCRQMSFGKILMRVGPKRVIARDENRRIINVISS
jgi:hypothetical protein